MTNHPDDVSTVPSLDLDRYLGTWFEICRLPLTWEDATARDITATYSLNQDGTIRVDNRCIDKNGKPARAVGQATSTEPGGAKLKVSFLPGFLRWLPFARGDYWVLRVAPAYDLALVGTPDRANLWLLSRKPQVADAIREDFLATARSQGFDLAALISPVQSGAVLPDAAFEP